MDNTLIKTFVAFVLLFSVSVHADTYPVVSTYNYGSHNFYTTDTLCPYVGSQVASGFASYTWVNPYCKFYNGSGTLLTQSAFYPTTSCPSGGTVSGSNCISAPVCLTPQVRSSVAPYACFTPVECRYPEVDTGSGQCQNITCPTGQNRNPSTSACQTPPACTAAYTYNSVTNACALYAKNCPLNQHASVDNLNCLADAPKTCPAGQHDDGTYNCAADDISACKSSQQSGTINGIPQCINKPNLDTVQQAAADAAQMSINKAATASAASIADNAAQVALASNPTDPATIAAATTAAAASKNAQNQLGVANATAVQAQGVANDNYLNSIDQTLKADKLLSDADRAAGFGLIPAPDAISTTSWSGSLGYTQVNGICPAPLTYTIRGESHSMSLQGYCDFMSNIRPVVLSLAFLTAGFIVVSGSKGGTN